ncbi:signal recognition particle-docking protein FtsY [Wolbachia endosymbiont of Howardula sp.]|uniref:signal recognition particle-docking protein FtsY n=1 Tax=Wolbachia endosymbiont of Howardula sp. TaxID=2916816 RepID=UPI00217D3058|nr:signal recognition particle-docking protein FtsY [Wolbachia endosymbiont of Howardula sp.]UWI83337.1 signal recognition particle-docking protein FtsY [Wolbachia endosymbiont of Howardula sp.]
MSTLLHLYKGLLKTSSFFSSGIKRILSNKKIIDQVILDNLEDLLISMDIGYKTSKLITSNLAHYTFNKDATHDVIMRQLIYEIDMIIKDAVHPIRMNKKPHIMMFCGVNGNGKTTTIGKLANKYKKIGKSVMLVACDTFRHAANEQLTIWAERSNCSILTSKHGSDPASLAYKAIRQAIHNHTDVVLIDTAGRIQNNINLMAELSKLYNTIKKVENSAPHDVILVLDATTGQNAYHQLEAFNKIVNVTGIIVTKVDGTAKGGVIVGLISSYKIKLYAVGTGESIEDIRECTSIEFIKALFNYYD